ncbi:hypothetical protein X975_12450, partial [Stegodyphus mimosarum]
TFDGIFPAIDLQNPVLGTFKMHSFSIMTLLRKYLIIL